MNTKYTTLLIIIFSIIFASNFIYAQKSGQLRGTTIESETGDPLIGANIWLDGTSLGAASDIDGKFNIVNIPPGEYKMIASYLGYKNYEETIQIKAGSTTEIDIKLVYQGAIETESVVITAQAKGQIDAINQQLSSTDIKNVVSAEHMKELPDANAAESIGRLPGVSILRSSGQGNKIVVRGLSPQYTNIEIEGIKVPASGDDRSVSLSNISSDILGGVELSKSLTADRDAGAIGGTINMKLKTAQKDFHLNTRAYGAVNGIDESITNGYFSLGVSDRFFDNKLGVLAEINVERLSLPVQSFGGSYSAPTWFILTDPTSGAEVDSGWNMFTNEANLSLRTQLRTRAGGSIVLDYKNDFYEVKFFTFFNYSEGPTQTRNNRFSFTDTQYPFRVDATDASGLNNMRTHSLQNTFNFWDTELDLNLSYTIYRNEWESQLFVFTDREALKNPVNESERLFAHPSTLIDYYQISSPKDVRFRSIDRKDFASRDDNKLIDLNWKIPFYLAGVDGKLQVGGEYRNKERTNDVNLTKSEFRWEGSERGRNFVTLYPNADELLADPNTFTSDGINLPPENFVDPDFSYGDFLDGRFGELGWTPDLEKLADLANEYINKFPGDFIGQGSESNIDDYVAKEDYSAAYIMTELNIGSSLMLLPGIRYEKMRTSYWANRVVPDRYILSGFSSKTDTTINQENEMWFPSLNMVIKTNNWSQIRGAVYKSTSRPSFQQISPMILYNKDGDRITSRNPYLKPAVAWNYDLGVYFHHNNIGLLTANGFYKEITGFIQSISYYPYQVDKIKNLPEAYELLGLDYFDKRFIGANTQVSIPVNNPNKTLYKGIELSWQMNFWFLPSVWQGLVLDVNFSYISSTHTYNWFNTVSEIDNSTFPPRQINSYFYESREDRMPNQPKYIYNIRLGWDYKGFSSRISFRYQTETVSAIDAKFGLRNSFRSDYYRVDLAFKQQIMEGLSVHADFANINNNIDDYYLEAFNSKTKEIIELPTRMEFYSYTIQVGLRYTL